MQDAATILCVIRERGTQGKPLERVYRLLYNPTFYLYAYGRISGNAGALTPGVTGETVDGMTVERIQRICDQMRREAYRWTPVRRTHIPKKSGGKRPLGIPTWSDKLVQEVIRLILEAYYEPCFSAHSHGFRPNRGCHTALKEVTCWMGTKWFVEGDINGCFDTIDHGVLLSILAESIHDNRFLRLIRHMLQAGYMENWVYGKTLSGTPQGGVVSPILSNIYLHKLDQFVEQHLLPAHNRGEKRRINWEYRSLASRLYHARKKGDRQAARRWAQALRRLPSLDPNDPGFRRLWYVRYADDFLLGFIGPKEEATVIKRQLGEYLHEYLKLTLSPEKTLITHATSDSARFLGYEITAQRGHDQITSGRRSINGVIALRVPREVLDRYCGEYVVDGHPKRHPILANESDYTIVRQYGAAFHGYYEYYRYAINVSWLARLQYEMSASMLHTLADKHRTSVRQIVRRYRAQVDTVAGPRRCFEVRVLREGRPPLIARFGGFPLSRQPVGTICDAKPYQGPYVTSNERVKRLLHEVCELCGAKGPVEGHHIRKLADLKRHGRTPPSWVRIMAARQRKTLFVCSPCHKAITHGRINIVTDAEHGPGRAV